MSATRHSAPRAARLDDGPALIALWALLFADGPPWQERALQWFEGVVDRADEARLPVLEVDGRVVAAAIGTLETGVPNPHCPTGRGVRLANLVTHPAHRRRGYGTDLVLDVVAWAGRIGADRVDLSATPDGERLYARLGFVATSAPRMKLVL